MYSSLLFLFLSRVALEVLGRDKAVAMTNFFMLVALALANEPSVAKEVPLVEVFDFHDVILSAKGASSVTAWVLVGSEEQLHKAKQYHKERSLPSRPQYQASL